MFGSFISMDLSFTGTSQVANGICGGLKNRNFLSNNYLISDQSSSVALRVQSYGTI